MKNSEISLCTGTGRFHTDKPIPGKIQKPLGGINWAEIVRQAVEPINVPKEQGNWIIPSNLRTRAKIDQIERGRFHLLTLDIDDDPLLLVRLTKVLTAVGRGAEFVAYHTKSATAAKPKARALVRMVEVDYVTWRCSMSVFYAKLRQYGVKADPALLEPQQIIYLPNRGDFYNYSHIPGGLFDPVAHWRAEMREVYTELFDRPTPTPKPTAERNRAAPPTTANLDGTISGIDAIRLFNATYPAADILTQAGYSERNGNFRHPNSSSGSYSVSIQDGKAHSLSPNDPLYLAHGGGRDAFDCFATLFHAGDRRAAMIDSCANWLTVGGVSVTEHNRQIYLANLKGAA